MEPSNTLSFYCSELGRTASEQTFGVKDIGKVTSATVAGNPSAEIEITLLEGWAVVVNLSLAGYRIVGREGPTFETLDYLLEAESLMWSTRRMEVLMEKLREVREEEGKDDEE